MRQALMLCALLSLAACADAPPIVTTPPAQCSRLIPESATQGVQAAPIPDNAPMLRNWLGEPLTDAMAAAIIAPWANAYVAQSGQLEKANERTALVMFTFSRCEELVNAARPDAQD